MASKRHVRQKSCTSKNGYDTWDQANYQLWQAKKRGEKSIQMYKCKFCHKYHIGHSGWIHP